MVPFFRLGVIRCESKKKKMWRWPGLLILVFFFFFELDFKRFSRPLIKGTTSQGEEAAQGSGADIKREILLVLVVPADLGSDQKTSHSPSILFLQR